MIDYDKVQELKDFLVMLPFIMSNMQHKTLRGGARYYRSENELCNAYLAFFENQSEDTWNGVVAAWGGESMFIEIRKAWSSRLFSPNDLGPMANRE